MDFIVCNLFKVEDSATGSAPPASGSASGTPAPAATSRDTNKEENKENEPENRLPVARKYRINAANKRIEQLTNQVSQLREQRDSALTSRQNDVIELLERLGQSQREARAAEAVSLNLRSRLANLALEVSNAKATASDAQTEANASEAAVEDEGQQQRGKKRQASASPSGRADRPPAPLPSSNSDERLGRAAQDRANALDEQRKLAVSNYEKAQSEISKQAALVEHMRLQKDAMEDALHKTEMRWRKKFVRVL